MKPGFEQIANETVEALSSANQASAERYQEISSPLSFRLAVEDFRSYSDCCIELASAGWRSFESLDKLLALTLRLPDDETVLRTARTAGSLAGYSYEPSARYLDAVEVVIGLEAQRCLPLLEASGLTLQSTYPHASTLITSFFRAATGIVEEQGIPALTEWLETAGHLVSEGREAIQGFLRISEEHTGLDWHQVRVVGLGFPRKVVDYLDSSIRLSKCFGDSTWYRANEFLMQFPGEPELVTRLQSLSELSPDGQDVMLSLAKLLDDIRVINAFLGAVDKLPLDRPAVIEHWLKTGIDQVLGDEVDALVAWVAVESRRSVTLLEKLRGQVRLEDNKHVLALIAESIVGEKVKVESSDMPDFRQGEQDLQSLPGIDGSRVSLPAWVNLFEEEVDNFGFYKVSLFHQLGFVEFGCFQSLDRVTSSLNAFPQPGLAQHLFLVIEAARIDWQLSIRFPGLTRQLGVQKEAAARARSISKRSPPAQLLEALVYISLDAAYEHVIEDRYYPDAAILWQILQALKLPCEVEASLVATRDCYEILQGLEGDDVIHHDRQVQILIEELPEPIAFRGELELAEVRTNLQIEAIIDAIEDEVESGEENPLLTISSMPDVDQLEMGEIVDGPVSEGALAELEGLDRRLKEQAGEEPGAETALALLKKGLSRRHRGSQRFQYDEWDCQINDYRARWCSLFEHQDMPLDHDYFADALAEHRDLAKVIRRELGRVKPEMLRKVRGVQEGEELDLERSIAYLIDRKAGLTPDDNVYIERQRRDRDVSTLFLLDMSASTDDIVPDPEAEPLVAPDVDDDEFLMEFFEMKRAMEADARRIIDLEKESVILMADALETLGDAYSVCGFSGYGKDQVDYYLCKDFDESLSESVRARIGGMRACRSTRMGPPIRHASKRLLETGSRIKALIIISDGYPQDHDYGTDRNSREYGLMDTMKALSEAHQQGITTYCLTVDPSGHDYLRAMCPDNQYMVIQDIVQLPQELSRVYRSLTS